MSAPADPSATLRAAAEVFVPGPPYDPTPGAADLQAERFIADYLDYLLPGLAKAVADLLDMMAAERFGGARFEGLRLSEREIVLESLEQHQDEQVRQLPELLGVLTVAAAYGEWTGIDAHGRLARTPWGWHQTRWGGPARERPRWMRR